MILAKLHPRLQDFVKNNNWKDLTPIQKAAFDPIFEGQSCILEAPTAGGKTEAVLFPLLTKITSNKKAGFKILYIAPLKALLNDLALRVIPYAKMCYLEAFKWHGDVSQSEKIEQFVFPSDILLTTPESIEAILLRKANWVEVFQNLQTIVIDEAHYFALTERGSHLCSLLERLCSGIKGDPQRIAVTATVGNPYDLLKWLTASQDVGSSIKVESSVEKKKDFQIQYFSEEGLRLQGALYKLLPNKKSIVFVGSRTGTEEIATRINEENIRSGSKVPVKVRTHHSSVSKGLREEAENSIKQQTETSIDAIISTSTLELGIDIGDLDQVIQIGGLNSSSSFLQRVGRTGRRIGRPQYFRGLCADQDELILTTGCVSLGLKHISESILFPGKAFHILAHQIICVCLQQRGTTKHHAWRILQQASCFSAISFDEFELLISHMVDNDYLRLIDNELLLISDKTESEFLGANWKRLFAIFDTGPMYNVVNGKKVIGTLDSGFARNQELPFVFVLGGQEWNALKVDHEKQQVLVEINQTGIAPEWSAIGNYDVPFELAQEVGEILMTNNELPFLDPFAKTILNASRETFSQLNWGPNKWILNPSTEFSVVYLWTFAGDKINRALSKLLNRELEQKPEFDYMQITIATGKKNPTTPEDLIAIIAKLKGHALTELEEKLEKEIKVKWFSKFSECLPDELARKAIREKDFDCLGLKRQLDSCSILVN